MPLRCSCGAVLPEDARFCHKCGQPQYAEDIARLNAVEEPPAYAAAETPLPVYTPQAPTIPLGFPNGHAVRISLGVAALSLLAVAFIAIIAPALVVPLFVAAGFAAVRLYLNRTHEDLKLLRSAVLGAMPWIWFFLLQAIGTAFLVLSPQGHEFAKALKNPEFTQFIDDPAKQILPLLFGFLIGSASGAVGGVLAARWQPRNRPLH